MKKKREKVKEIYIDADLGVVFVTEDGNEHTYKYFSDASGGICDIELIGVTPKKQMR